MTVDEYIDEGNRRREALFKVVEPMRGAAALVNGLVSVRGSGCRHCSAGAGAGGGVVLFGIWDDSRHKSS